MYFAATIAVVLSVLVLAFQARELAGQSRVANEVAETEVHRETLPLGYRHRTDLHPLSRVEERCELPLLNHRRA